ncbi:MAG: phosphate ABC transporter substrate-binding protein PstS [Gemmataceae bacterium]
MLRWSTLLVVFTTLNGCGPTQGSVTIQASGATFPAPLYQRWFLELYRADPSLRVNYQPVGSGAGIRQFSEGLTLLGATDAPLKDDEIHLAEQRLGAPIFQVPLTAGAIALCYNLPGVPADRPVRLSRKVLLDFLLQTPISQADGERTITHWNDPLIQELNLDLSLPNLPITWIRRSEGSGSTFALTTHLAAVRPEWKQQIGINKSVTWRVGLGAKGTDGVAALIEQTPGALGYVEYGFAELAHLSTVALENRAGVFVRPSPASNAAALRGVPVPEDYRVSVPDPEPADAYPIVTYTWIIGRKRYPDEQTAAAIRKTLRYALNEGQQLSSSLGYIPLPAEVVARVHQVIDEIQP